MSDLLPLRFERYFYFKRLDEGMAIVDDSRGDGPQIVYGERRYVTANNLFTIAYVDGWQIFERDIRDKWQLRMKFAQSGLPEARFPRRCDAIEALEVFLQGEDVP